MRKNKLIKLIAILFCFFVVVNIENVQAESCTTKELNSLKQLAHNLKFSYELTDDTYNEEHSYNFNIMITNLNEKIYIKAYNGLASFYEGKPEVTFYSMSEGRTYSFFVYASSKTNCEDTLLVTKKVEVPYYNDYSQKEECIEYEEFELCQPYYGGYIESDEYFEQQLEKYKESLKDKTEEKEKRTIFDIIIDFYITNLIITVPCTLLVIGMIIFIVIRIIKNKKKVKVRI